MALVWHPPWVASCFPPMLPAPQFPLSLRDPLFPLLVTSLVVSQPHTCGAMSHYVTAALHEFEEGRSEPNWQPKRFMKAMIHAHKGPSSGLSPAVFREFTCSGLIARVMSTEELVWVLWSETRAKQSAAPRISQRDLIGKIQTNKQTK